MEKSKNIQSVEYNEEELAKLVLKVEKMYPKLMDAVARL